MAITARKKSLFRETRSKRPDYELWDVSVAYSDALKQDRIARGEEEESVFGRIPGLRTVDSLRKDQKQALAIGLGAVAVGAFGLWYRQSRK